MAGRNPFMRGTAPPPPTRPYRLTLKNTGQTFEVPTEPNDEPGQPCSILSVLLKNGVEIDHACGGVCACSTCHVYVRAGVESTNEATDDEEDMLDTAPALLPCSRLACQAVPDGSEDVEVELPAWNRNLVKEGH